MGNWLRSSFGELLLFRVLDFSFGTVGNKLAKRKKKGVGVKQSMMGYVDTSKL